MARWPALALAVVVAGSGVAWALGGRWWVLDLANHFVPQWIAVALVAAALAWRVDRRVAGLLVVAAAAHLARWWPAVDPGPTDGRPVKVLLANVLSSNPDRQRLLDLVAAEDPDLIGLLEVTPAWLADLGALRDGWPASLEAPRDDNFGLALYGRGLESVEVRSFGPVPSIVARLGRTTVVLTHPVPPVGRDATAARDAQLAALPLDGDAWVVIGDLNATPWSAGFPRVPARAVTWGTWPSWAPVRIPIDHVLAGPAVGLRSRRVGPDLGSDHRPVLAELRVP